MKWLAAWWGQADHFDWLTGYLQAHGLSSNTRRLMAGVAASLVLVPANVWLGPAPVYRPVALAYSVLAAVTRAGHGDALVAGVAHSAPIASLHSDR